MMELNEPALGLLVTIFKLNIKKKSSGEKSLLLITSKVIKDVSIATKHKI